MIMIFHNIITYDVVMLVTCLSGELAHIIQQAAIVYTVLYVLSYQLFS